MTTLNLGQVRPVYRGTWANSATYKAYDWVAYDGSAYLALKDVPENYIPSSQTEYWVLFGAKGEQGEKGDQGIQGQPGAAGTTDYDDLLHKPVSDTTLSVSGSFADAKTVGDSLSELASATSYARPSLFSVSKTSVTIPADTQVKINGSTYRVSSDKAVSISSITSRAGKDLYVYACVPESGTEPDFVISLNSTVPDGYTADNSRKIGGFHCLCVAVGTISGHTLSGYSAGDIIPNSQWDLLHRATSENEGMVWVPEIGKWVDIYLPTYDGSKLASTYNAVIADGGSTVSFNGSKFAEYAGLVGKQLISYDEFTVCAKGSNEGTNISNSTDPDTTGGHIDTAGRRMISNYGLEDCCGVLWQWSRTLFEGANTGGSNTTSWTTSNNYLNGYGWYTNSVYNSTYDSQGYGSCIGLLRRAMLGVDWGAGAACGSRSVFCRVFSSDGWLGDSARLVSMPRA